MGTASEIRPDVGTEEEGGGGKKERKKERKQKKRKENKKSNGAKFVEWIQEIQMNT